MAVITISKEFGTDAGQVAAIAMSDCEPRPRPPKIPRKHNSKTLIVWYAIRDNTNVKKWVAYSCLTRST